MVDEDAQRNDEAAQIHRVNEGGNQGATRVLNIQNHCSKTTTAHTGFLMTTRKTKHAAAGCGKKV